MREPKVNQIKISTVKTEILITCLNKRLGSHYLKFIGYTNGGAGKFQCESKIILVAMLMDNRVFVMKEVSSDGQTSKGGGYLLPQHSTLETISVSMYKVIN